MLVFAARAAGVDPLDTVYARVTDDEGLRREAEFIKQLGFAGKSVIHPNQIAIVHDVFNPTEAEIAKAQKIIAAAKEAAARGQGAVSVDGKMVDVPRSQESGGTRSSARGSHRRFAAMTVNAVKREIPDYIEGYGKVRRFEGAFARKPEGRIAGAKLRCFNNDRANKVAPLAQGRDSRQRPQKRNDDIVPPPSQKRRLRRQHGCSTPAPSSESRI